MLREALRRSYAEAGFDLVDGSFQTGFVLVDAKSVAIDESSGIVYSGAPGSYPANTPTSGFLDVSEKLLRNILYVKGIIATNMRLYKKI